MTWRSPSRPSGGDSERSPTPALIIGLLVTLLAVIGYSWYVRSQIAGLRELQSNLVERNRRESLQLLRIQNNLNAVGLAMRDMLDQSEPYPITAWRAQFDRIRIDLVDALRRQEESAAADRTPEQRDYLEQQFKQFWDATDRMFAIAATGGEAEARDQIRVTLQARQAALATAVARQLVQNNEREEAAAERIGAIYAAVQRQVYVFLGATLIAILLTSVYLIRSNRVLFSRLGALSAQRRDLAQKLISTQESTLRYISRELHDEFGQILTAIGSMLARAGRQLPQDAPLRGDLREVQQLTQQSLDNVRTLSQSLHPVMLEEAGLESTLEWYLPAFERQTGLQVTYEKRGVPFPLLTSTTVHVYRVIQEALNNAARHSGAKDVSVRLSYEDRQLEVEVQDNGRGFDVNVSRQGIGLVGMRERADLVNGRVEFTSGLGAGTRVRLTVPFETGAAHGA